MSHKVSPLQLPLHACPPKVNIGDDFDLRQLHLRSMGWPPHAFDRPVEILPMIWLSGIGFDADIPAWCRQNNFTHLINTAGYFARAGYYKTHPNDNGLKYLELDIEDTPRFNMKPSISKLYEFLQDVHDKKGKVLIHCIWGQSRSVACLMAFLMLDQNIDYDNALNIVKKARPIALPNPGFEAQLRSLNRSV